jgi:hypothetical protein
MNTPKVSGITEPRITAAVLPVSTGVIVQTTVMYGTSAGISRGWQPPSTDKPANAADAFSLPTASIVICLRTTVLLVGEVCEGSCWKLAATKARANALFAKSTGLVRAGVERQLVLSLAVGGLLPRRPCLQLPVR